MATVAVLGPGGVGGALAVRLALSGTEVVCVARPETAVAIARDGLALETGDETLRARPQATDRLEHAVDLLLVTVKSYDLEAALDRIDPDRGVGVVLPLLNGIEHMITLRARLGAGTRVAAASIGRIEAVRTAPTVVRQSTLTPVVTVSTATGGCETALDLLRQAGVDVRTAASDADVLWEKLARLAPLAAITAVAQTPLGELLGDEAWRARLERCVHEACAVAAADGAAVTYASEWAMIEAMPATLTTSAARDVASGRRSELDAIVGGVTRAGRRVGVATPSLDELQAELDGR